MNGIFFFARRMKDPHADIIECKIQITNLKRHLRKGLTRDKEKLLLPENEAMSFMPERLMRQFWFNENQTKINKARRIDDFRQIGWTDPFIHTEQNLPP